MSDDGLQRAIDAGGGLFGSHPTAKIDFSVPEEPSVTDRPYTNEAVAVVREALYQTQFAQTLDDDAHAVLTALAAAGLLVTPRIEQDARMLGRAYIWRRPGGEPLVLNPMDVDVVLPQEPT